MREDTRVDHQALPLEDIDGVKIGTNVWIHLRPFRPRFYENTVYDPVPDGWTPPEFPYTLLKEQQQPQQGHGGEL